MNWNILGTRTQESVFSTDKLHDVECFGTCTMSESGRSGPRSTSAASSGSGYRFWRRPRVYLPQLTNAATTDSGNQIERRGRALRWSWLKNTVLIGRANRSRRSLTLPTREQQDGITSAATPRSPGAGDRRGDQSGDGVGSASHPAESSTPGILQDSAAAQTSRAQVSGNNLFEDGLASGGSNSAQEQPESSTSSSLPQTNPLQGSATSQTSPVAGSSSRTSAQPPFDVKSVDDLKKILDFIERAAKIAEEPGTSTSILEKPRVPDIVKDNLEGATNAIQNIASLCKDVIDPKGLGKVMATEAVKVLRNVLTGVGNLHWAGAGLLLLASVLNRIDQKSTNKEGCVMILRRLIDLGGQLVRLYQLFEEKDKIVQAATCVAEGAVLCNEYLSYGHIKRFGLAETHNSQFEALEDRIRHLYSDLQLSAITEGLSVNTDIRNRTPMPLDSSYRPEYPTLAVGIKEKHSEALKSLGVSEGTKIATGVQALLIHGMGGIGKTTLANAICGGALFLKHSFSEIKFDENVTERDICRCQSIIYERLSGIPRKIENCDEGRKALAESFKALSNASRNPILLLVDNVFNATDLNDLFPYPLDLPDRSRIVVTSRNSGVISDAYCMRDVRSTEYSVSGLDPRQAWDLLQHHVGERPRHREREIDLVLEWCDGLPLALEMMGAYLRVEKNEGWKAVVRLLERHKDCENVTGLMVDRRLDEIFNLSYNALGRNVQGSFLDVTCLLRQEDMEWVESPKLKAMEKVSLVKKLIERSRRDTFAEAWKKWGIAGADRMSSAHVHDHCVSFAKHLAGETRLVSIDDKFLPNLLQEDDKAGCGKVEGLVVKFCGQPLLAGKLDVMCRSLRILILEEVQLLGDCQRTAYELEIYSVRRGTLPYYNNFQRLQRLRVLDFHCIDGSHLENAQLPVTLEVLKLVEVESFRRFHWNAFQDCSSLHTVHIEYCWSLWELPENFGELSSLSVLVLSENSDLKSLPTDFHRLENLQSVFMRGLPRTILPSGFGKLPNLQELFLSEISYSPDGFSELTSLKYLFLENTKDKYDSSLEMVSLPPQLGRLSLLQVLDIRGDFEAVDCSQLKSLLTLRMTTPTGMNDIHPVVGGLVSLQELVLLKCNSLQRLPEDISQFKSLQTLRLGGCQSLKELPKRFGELGALKELRLEGCSSLQRLPEGFSQLKSLESLVLWDCVALAELPQEFWSMLALVTLELRRCTRLACLPSDVSHLNSLETISLTSCRSLETLPEGFAKLPQLHSLELEGCETMQVLPGDIFKLNKLRKLSLTGCKSLKELPLIHENGLLLEQLLLSGCQSLIQLPANILKLNYLEQLWLSGCKSLEELPEGFETLPQLHWLDLSWCDRFRHLPNDFFNLKKLCYLNLQGCTSLQEIPPIHNYALALQRVNLSGCCSLVLLPKDLGKVKSLEELKLSGCRLLEKIPEGLGNLPRLIWSDLTGCKTLQALPGDIFNCLKNLRSMDLLGCESLIRLPVFQRNRLEDINLRGCAGLIQLPTNLPELNFLLRLKLHGCQSLEELPSGFENLPQLDWLDLTGCQKLRHLPDDFFQLRSLRFLSLRGCKSLQGLPPIPETGLSLLELDITECEGIIQLPDNFFKLRNIEEVSLEKCKSLCQLPQMYWTGLTLKKLSLSGCGSLAHLPRDLPKLKSLVKLTLQGCKALEKLPEDFTNLLPLESLDLTECERIQYLPDDFFRLKNLTFLCLKGCKALRALPPVHKHVSIKICRVALSGCEGLVHSPNDVSQLHASNMLRLSEGFADLCTINLDLDGFETLHCLPDDIFNRRNLCALHLEGCKSLEQLPEVPGVQSALEVLNLSGCEGLLHLPVSVPDLHASKVLRLPKTFTNLAGLKTLYLKNLETLQDLPEDIFRLNLENLYLQGCKSLKELPQIPEHGLALEQLDLSECEGLSQLPTNLPKLISLKILRLRGCRLLTGLPDEFENLGLLNKLVLEGCSALQRLPDNFFRLASLHALNLKNCKSLKTLPPIYDSQFALNVLNISGCESLEELSDSMSKLRAEGVQVIGMQVT